MEPNNLENQIEQKLNSREIQPSQMAWDRLDAMLTVAEKPKRKFPFLMIAASFLVFTTLGFLAYHFTQNENTVTNEIVVGSDKIEIQKKDENQNKIINSKEKIEVVQPNQSVNSLVSAPNKKSKSVQKISIINQNSNENSDKDHSIQEEVVVNSEKEIKNNDNKNINVNAEMLLASVDSKTEIKQQNITVPKIKVNPNSLLSEVDTELTVEYRENVFQKINRTFQK